MERKPLPLKKKRKKKKKRLKKNCWKSSTFQFSVQGLIFIVDHLLARRELLCDFIYIIFIMEQMLTIVLLNLYHDSLQDKESFKWQLRHKESKSCKAYMENLSYKTFKPYNPNHSSFPSSLICMNV